MKRLAIRAGIALALGLGSMLALLWLLGGPQVVRAADLTVCPTGPPTCGYSTVQAAVDAASDGDVIKVAAGTYSGVQKRPAPAGYVGPSVIAQVVYISKTVTLRGGYTTAFADPPDPEANPTTLDAQEQGRVLLIASEISPTIEGLRITGGDAIGLGGLPDVWASDVGSGVYIISATATLSGSRVFSNTAISWGGGGGLALIHASATLSGNIVSGNGANDVGGGLYLYESAATLSGNTISGNTSGGSGGGLYLDGSAATLSENTVSSNTANDDCGGLCLYLSDATLSGNVISRNTAENGGGLSLVGSDATLSANTIISNTASFYGGGLRLDESPATLSGNTISGNTSGRDGGGLWLIWCSAATLSGNTISGNTAGDTGGGLWLYDSTATLSDNTISGNTAAGGGGGLNVNAGFPVTLSGNMISGNTAAEDGGGLHVVGDVTLSGNTIISNTADDRGGGLFIGLGWPGDPTLINNLVADNHANTAGSGLYVENSSPRLRHTTIARNSGGDGSGVYVTDQWGPRSAVAMANTILVSHTVGIYVDADNTATLEATLWGDGAWANETDWDGDGDIITGTRNFWGDPAFIDPDTGDYHITSTSAAIDVGVDAGVSVDIDGEPRPAGIGYDLGADEEWHWVEDWHWIYLPVVLRNHP